MRALLVLRWCSVLFSGAMSIIGCGEVWREPVGYTPALASTRPQPQPGVPSAQAPEAERGFAEERPAIARSAPEIDEWMTEPSRSAASPDVDSPVEPHSDGRARAARMLGLASRQVDRLRRMEQSGNDSAPRADLDARLSDLEATRQRVLGDLREYELRPAEDALAKLDGDVAFLEQALRASYVIAPDPSRGLPPPAPLPPSRAW